MKENETKYILIHSNGYDYSPTVHFSYHPTMELLKQQLIQNLQDEGLEFENDETIKSVTLKNGKINASLIENGDIIILKDGEPISISFKVKADVITLEEIE